MSDKDNITIRVEDEDGELLAFIWNKDSFSGCILCYSTVGQHAEATHEYYIEETGPIRSIDDIEKAQILIEELRSIGYKI